MCFVKVHNSNFLGLFKHVGEYFNEDGILQFNTGQELNSIYLDNHFRGTSIESKLEAMSKKTMS